MEPQKACVHLYAYWLSGPLDIGRAELPVLLAIALLRLEVVNPYEISDSHSWLEEFDTTAIWFVYRQIIPH